MNIIYQKKNKVVLFFLIAIGLLQSCVGAKGVRDKGKLYTREGTDVITIGVDRRVAFLRSNKEDDCQCLAPPPDAMLFSSFGMSLSSTLLKGTQEGIGEKSGSDIMALGGRTPLVLISRELMYRACEFTTNQKLSKVDAMKVYQDFLRTIVALSKVKEMNGTQATSGQRDTDAIPVIKTTPLSIGQTDQNSNIPEPNSKDNSDSNEDNDSGGDDGDTNGSDDDD